MSDSVSDGFPQWALTLGRTIVGAFIMGSVGWGMNVQGQLTALGDVDSRLTLLESSVHQNETELAVVAAKLDYLREGIDEIKAMLQDESK